MVRFVRLTQQNGRLRWGRSNLEETRAYIAKLILPCGLTQHRPSGRPKRTENRDRERVAVRTHNRR